MIKTIFKESMIILLLCVAILFILSLLFYDYNPINKIVPSKIAYEVPENIKNELEGETLTNTFEIQNRVYRVEGSDLNIYKSSKSYDPSKDNPFASTVEDDATTTGNILNNNISGGSSGGSTSNGGSNQNASTNKGGGKIK